MQEKTTRISTTCAACGGDPGGIVWEGIVLLGMLRTSDIVTLTRGAVDQRTVARLFRTRQLHGIKPGKAWATRASQFVADWDVLERRRSEVVRSEKRAPRIVEVAAR